jgi:SOS-response transcriptional repressor LexA
MEITSADIVKRVDQVLSERHISYLELCRGAGISDHSITDWKGTRNKKGSMPSADKLFKVAAFLKISLYWLLAGKDEADLTPEQRDLLWNYDKLDKRDKQTVLDLIETMLKKQKKEERPVYSATQPISYSTKEAEPAYPQPVKVHKQPKIDNNVAAFVPVYYIPFYGKAAAGRPIDINIPPDRVVPVPGPVLKGDKSRYFSVEIKGTSMTRAGIKDGDYAIMRRAMEAENGKVMLVRYGNESTVKRIKIEGGKVFLCWEDGSGETIEVDSSEYEIQGEFVKALRDLE